MPASGVVAMLVCWIYFFSQAGYPPDLKYKFLGMLPVATIFLVSAVTLVVVSLLTRPPSDQTLARFFPDGQDKRAAG